LKKKINQGKDKIQKKIAIKIIGTKYDKWKKLKEDEIDKKKKFHELFQIKKIIIKRIENKIKGKTNWRAVLKKIQGLSWKPWGRGKKSYWCDYRGF
jgi:hypothetical protein